jgi:polar amino acid transport system permease protein
MGYDLSFGYVWDYRFAIADGLMVTLYFAAISLVIGLVIGFVTSIARQSDNPIVYWISTAYVEIFRGTPVLIQLFWFFFCLPAILGVEIGNATSTITALSLYMGALSSESFRAALKSIGVEQHDACVALGLPARVKIPFVILPQATMRAVPTLMSNCVTLFKESALVSAVGMADLMYQGQTIADSTARPIEILTVVAFIYFIIAFTITRLVSVYERRLLGKFIS